MPAKLLIFELCDIKVSNNLKFDKQSIIIITTIGNKTDKYIYLKIIIFSKCKILFFISSPYTNYITYD